MEVAAAEKDLIKQHLGHVAVEANDGASQPKGHGAISSGIDDAITKVVGLKALYPASAGYRKGPHGIRRGFCFCFWLHDKRSFFFFRLSDKAAICFQPGPHDNSTISSPPYC
jgi:hypothetical protein